MSQLRVAVCIALALSLTLASGCGGGSGPGGPNSTDPNVGVQLIVQQVLPTNGQEVLPNLSDAGQEEDAGVITVKFSEKLDPSAVMDPANAQNGLTADVNILDSSFARVAGTPSIGGPRGNILYFKPSDPTLPNGQYTVTVTRNVKSFDGSPLNRGLRDHLSSFTVGTDTYAPVIRQTFPVASQKDVVKDSQIIITMNEPMNPATVNSGTITVVDGGQNPPVAVNGTITLENNGFEIVFTPDPANPMPPNSTIVVTVAGGASGITDVVGNPFAGIPSGTDTYQFSFETQKEPPEPDNPFTYWGGPNPPPNEAGIYFGADKKFGVINERNYIGNWNDLSTWGPSNPVTNSEIEFTVDGRTGRIGDIVVDPRFNPSTSYSWIYVTDIDNHVLHVVHSEYSRIVYTFRDLPDPTGLSVGSGGRFLYVTNRANDTVSRLEIGTVTPGTRGASDALKALSHYQNRSDLAVGRAPKGVSNAPDNSWVGVCNTQGDSVSFIDPVSYTVKHTVAVNSGPQDLVMTPQYADPEQRPFGRFAYVVCNGSGTGAGSVDLCWFSYEQVTVLTTPPNQWTFLAKVDTGFNTPSDCIFDYGQSAWVVDSGTNQATEVSFQIQLINTVIGRGNVYGPVAVINNTVATGIHPSSVTVEPWVYLYTNGQTQPYVVIVACEGSNEIQFFDRREPSRPAFSIPIPQVHKVASYLDQ